MKTGSVFLNHLCKTLTYSGAYLTITGSRGKGSKNTNPIKILQYLGLTPDVQELIQFTVAYAVGAWCSLAQEK
jgi:hypothetical protein